MITPTYFEKKILHFAFQNCKFILILAHYEEEVELHDAQNCVTLKLFLKKDFSKSSFYLLKKLDSIFIN